MSRTQNERILAFDAAMGVRIDLGALLTWKSRIAPENLPDRALDIRRCLINISVIFRNITTHNTPPVLYPSNIISTASS